MKPRLFKPLIFANKNQNPDRIGLEDLSPLAVTILALFLSAFCFLPSAFAFCFLPSAFCLLLSAFCLLPTAFFPPFAQPDQPPWQPHRRATTCARRAPWLLLSPARSTRLQSRSPIFAATNPAARSSLPLLRPPLLQRSSVDGRRRRIETESSAKLFRPRSTLRS